MIKKISIILVLLMISGAAFSNVKIAGKHKDLKKQGTNVNCAFCHAGEMKIEKKKGQIKGEAFNGIKFSKIKSCTGQHCHM